MSKDCCSSLIFNEVKLISTDPYSSLIEFGLISSRYLIKVPISSYSISSPSSSAPSRKELSS